MQFLLLFLRSPNLVAWEARDLAGGKTLGPTGRDRRAGFERVVAVEAPGEPEVDGPFRHAAAAILRYDIFPSRLVTPVLRRAPVQIGDTVGTQYHFLPGIDLFFASQVVDCFDERGGDSWRSGFTYRTLAGHPVIGEEMFSVEKDVATGRVTVALRSWSRPGIWLARATRPLMRWLQFRAGRAALDHLQAVVTAPASGCRSSSWP
ncbi:MAG TPA: DUF1990 family protein [Gemmataceae bacterium]|nr:DUF1990 family protein [Gemmataceae bacterium]